MHACKEAGVCMHWPADVFGQCNQATHITCRPTDSSPMWGELMLYSTLSINGFQKCLATPSTLRKLRKPLRAL